MKSKLFSFIAIVLIAVVPTLAQVGGNDWTKTDGAKHGPQTLTAADGTKSDHYYEIFYSPSSLTHIGDVVTSVIDTVYTDSTPTKFYTIQINCKTMQYTFAQFDVSTTPATPGETSAWKPIQSGSAGSSVAPIFCKQ